MNFNPGKDAFHSPSKSSIHWFLLAVLLSACIVHGATPPVLMVNGVSADYTTTHLFVDETTGDSLPLTLSFAPNANSVVAAEIFSNLNRRARAVLDANGDGVEDGIISPNGNQIGAG